MFALQELKVVARKVVDWGTPNDIAMRIKYLLSLPIIVSTVLSISCGQQKQPETKSNSDNETLELVQSFFSKEEIALYTVSAIMNHPPSIISAELENGIYNVKYNRTSDGQAFEYRIKFKGANKVIWANKDGRWRDTEFDEEVTYSEKGNKLTITQTFDDGSTVDKEFEKEKA